MADYSFAGVFPFEGDRLFVVSGVHKCRKGVTVLEPLMISAKDKQDAEFIYGKKITEDLKKMNYPDPYRIQVTARSVTQDDVYSRDSIPDMGNLRSLDL